MAGEEKQIVVEETTVVPGKMEFRLISPTESNFFETYRMEQRRAAGSGQKQGCIV